MLEDLSSDGGECCSHLASRAGFLASAEPESSRRGIVSVS